MPKIKSFSRYNTVNSSNVRNANQKKKDNKNLNISNKRRIDDLIYNLSEDIKQYQHDLKILGPHHKNVETLYKKILLKLSENNHEIIQTILNKKKRTNEELIVIKTFLSTMKYLSSMLTIIDTDKVLFSLSVYLKMESKNKDSILFRYGAKGTKFYILLSGQVTILILKETKVQISFLRYFLHLLLLKMMNEDELLKKTIVANKNFKYKLDEKIFDIFYEKLQKYWNKNNKSQKHKKDGKKNDDEEESSIEESENFFEKEEINNNDNKPKEVKDLLIKKKNTLKLNYLCSNYNERATSYIYTVNNVKSEEKNNHEEHHYIFDKRTSVRFTTPNRKNILQSLKFSPTNYEVSDIGPPLFYKEEEIKEIISYYFQLKEALGNYKKKKITVKDYIRDTYINSNYNPVIKEDRFNNKDNFIIYSYIEIVQKNKGDTFGELALQHEDSKRTATIITNTDCILGFLSKNDYETCLSEIELKRRKNEVNFIMSFAIFDQMNWISFENKYFNYFKRECFYQGETILTQGKPTNRIFFIMDGQFEISSTLSIASLYRLIRQKTNYSFQRLKIRLKKKLHNIRLSICNNRDILGLNDCLFYGFSGDILSFVTATCISNKGIAFTLDLSILKELKHKMSEIDDNLKQIIKRREKLMLDRLISIFDQLVKLREININEKKKAIEKRKNNLNKKDEGYVINYRQINYILNKDTDNKQEENYSPYKNLLLSAKYREVRPLSKESRNKFISLENEKILLKGNITQERRILSSKKYNLKMNLKTLVNNMRRVNEAEYNKNITDIMVIKENFPIQENPRIFLKSAVSIRELNEKKNVEKKMKNLYLPLNNIIHKEYNNLFNWIDYTKKLSESYKRINYEENEYTNKKEEESDNNIKENVLDEDSKKISFSSDNDKESLYIQKEKSNQIKREIKPNNIRKTLKILVMEKEKKEKKEKKKKCFSQSNDKFYDTNEKEINRLNKVNQIKEYSNILNQKIYYLKTKKLSNEKYLKQILGIKYKNEEDKYISRTEKRIIKEINAYNEELRKKNEAKIKFMRKNKDLKKLFYINTDFHNYNKSRLNNLNSINNKNNKANVNDKISNNNYKIS